MPILIPLDMLALLERIDTSHNDRMVLTLRDAASTIRMTLWTYHIPGFKGTVGDVVAVKDAQVTADSDGTE